MLTKSVLAPPSIVTPGSLAVIDVSVTSTVSTMPSTSVIVDHGHSNSRERRAAEYRHRTAQCGVVITGRRRAGDRVGNDSIVHAGRALRHGKYAIDRPGFVRSLRGRSNADRCRVIVADVDRGTVVRDIDRDARVARRYRVKCNYDGFVNAFDQQVIEYGYGDDCGRRPAGIVTLPLSAV